MVATQILENRTEMANTWVIKKPVKYVRKHKGWVERITLSPDGFVVDIEVLEVPLADKPKPTVQQPTFDEWRKTGGKYFPRKE